MAREGERKTWTVPNPYGGGKTEHYGDESITQVRLRNPFKPGPVEEVRDDTRYVAATLEPDGTLGESRVITPAEALGESRPSGSSEVFAKAREDGAEQRRRQLRTTLGLADA